MPNIITEPRRSGDPIDFGTFTTATGTGPALSLRPNPYKSNYGIVVIQLIDSSWPATNVLSFQGTVDDTNWAPVAGVRLDTQAAISTMTGTTNKLLVRFDVCGLSQFAVVCSTAGTAGTMVVTGHGLCF